MEPETQLFLGPQKSEPRRPDMMIGMKDWEFIREFLHNDWESLEVKENRKQVPRFPEIGESRKQVPPLKWHIRIRMVLQNGERTYLNVHKSLVNHRSKITSQAAAKLERKSEGECCMNLVDENSTGARWPNSGPLDPKMAQ